MKDVICELEQQECDTIRELFEKKLALENLAKIIIPEENPAMYERLLVDYGKTIHLFNDWWDNTFNKYQCVPGNYSVNFSDHTVVSVEHS